MTNPYEILLEQGRCWLWRVKTPVDKYTEKEMETYGVDQGSAEAAEYVDAVLDIGSQSPLGYIRPSNIHDDATTFYNRTGDGYVICVPFEDFLCEYVAWLKRHPELYETEDTGNGGDDEKVMV